MKVSTKGRYGLRALVDLAVQPQDIPVPLASIAKRQNISLNYLEQVFGTLRKAGFVKSVKGPSGGYLLAKGAEHTSVKEILESLEGRFSIVDDEESSQDAIRQAIQKLVWHEIDENVNEHLAKRTLGQLIDEYRMLVGENTMYYI